MSICGLRSLNHCWMTRPSGKRGLIERNAATVKALLCAVSGVMKPASSMRSSASKCPSAFTIAIATGTFISSAFSTTALMNSRHSTARSFAMTLLLTVGLRTVSEYKGRADSMKNMPRLFIATLLMLTASGAWPQSGYPAKPVRIVLGFPPASAADIVARVVGAKMAEGLGQQVVIDNRPGASSNIATELVVRAPADGYTLLMGTIANTINASLYAKLPFDFARDLTPIVAVAAVPNLLVVHPSLPVHSVKELIKFAQAKPGEILYGSSGNGTGPHLSGELFNLMAHVKLVHIPYKGSPQAVTDLLGGRVMVMFAPSSTALPHMKAGTLRGLASSGAQRTSAAPDLPTIAEAGLPGFETSVWFGLLAPAATPRDIVERVNRETLRALGDADVKKQFAAQGIDAMGGTPDQFAAYIREETAKWARVVQASGAKID